MRFIKSLLSIMIAAALVIYFLPWWMAAVVCFLISFIAGLRPAKAFLAGCLGIGLLWLGIVLLADMPNEHILSRKMAVLFRLPGYIWFIIVTVLVGALTGGLPAWSGALARKAFYPDR